MLTDHLLKPEYSELGKASAYDATYNPDKLFPIARKKNREALGIFTLPLPFYGFDFWNHYEVSWLNEKGKPIVAIAEIIYECTSINIIESKSMKLYFNSFNNSQFKNAQAVAEIVKNDLSARLEGGVLEVRIIPIADFKEEKLAAGLSGISIDELDIECSVYHADPVFLTTENEEVEEILYTDLLKSNCLVTNQPDWCSVQIAYKGKKINREGLLRYIVSFRNDNEFHEQCIEKIFIHISKYCQPTELTVYGRSTRRGGVDINSYRSSLPVNLQSIKNIRLCRQ
jgi:7-cyano-7-deazaguanine reductase